MQIGPFDVEPTAWGRTERRREDGRGEGGEEWEEEEDDEMGLFF